MSAADLTFDDLDDAACQRALAVLVDVGTAIVQELKAPDPATLAARAAAFERVALAVRRTILLSQHIAAGTAARAAIPAERTHHRKEIIRAVETKIAQHADPQDAPALRVELLERLDSPDFDADLAHHKPAVLINRLCEDLGAIARGYGAPKTIRRTPEDIRRLCQEAARRQPEHDPFTIHPLPIPLPLPPENDRTPLPLAGQSRSRCSHPPPDH